MSDLRYRCPLYIDFSLHSTNYSLLIKQRIKGEKLCYKTKQKLNKWNGRKYKDGNKIILLKEKEVNTAIYSTQDVSRIIKSLIRTYNFYEVRSIFYISGAALRIVAIKSLEKHIFRYLSEKYRIQE